MKTEISPPCCFNHLFKWELLFMEQGAIRVRWQQPTKLSLRYYHSLERPFPYEKRNKLLKEFSLYTTACIHPRFSNLLYSEAIIWEFCFCKHKKLWNYITLLSLMVYILLTPIFLNIYEMSMCWPSTFSLTHQNLVLLPKKTWCWWLNLLPPANHFSSSVLHLKQGTDKTVSALFTRHMFSCSKQF